jgi:predicted secreted protein
VRSPTHSKANGGPPELEGWDVSSVLGAVEPIRRITGAEPSEGLGLRTAVNDLLRLFEVNKAIDEAKAKMDKSFTKGFTSILKIYNIIQPTK